ncbi:MAG TPA: amidase family protein [Dehalococcoidia bacterium]|nr:amidase family protein [Dehalococcoidia bacterium]
MDATDLCFTPATELGRLIRTREVSPVEMADAVLTRIDRLNPRLGAFLTITSELARDQARASEARALRGELIGPLDGIPFSLKDLEPTAGIRTTFGSKWFEQNVPAEDGAVAARLRATGGVLLGKTNTPNFGYKDMTDNLVGPPARNPWHLDRTPGGSSGGAAAAIAAGLGPLAHGTDAAGSIRIPAALCGIFGLKPSFGRVPYFPTADLWAARSHCGPMTRTVRDAALLLQAMAGPDPRDPLTIDAPPEDYLAACDGDLKGLRVVWSPDLGYAAVEPEVRSAAEAAARRFTDLGCTVEEPVLGWPDPHDFHQIIYEANVAARQIDRAAERPDWIEPTLMRIIVNTNRISAVQYAQALVARTTYWEAIRPLFATYDLLLTPQMPVGAWSVEPGPDEGVRAIADRPTRSMFDRLPFTYPFNLTGQPAATVPCGSTSEGLPIGLQIVGRWHADTTVLRAAAGFEAMRPWAQHRPSLG